MIDGLVDTNVVSELTKPAPSRVVEAFLRQSRDRVYMSVLSVGEIRRGILNLPVSQKRSDLEFWLDQEILPWFGHRVLPVNLEVAECWGAMTARLKRLGKPRPVVDTLLAATASVHGLTIVTRNVADYADCGVAVINPWEQH